MRSSQLSLSMLLLFLVVVTLAGVHSSHVNERTGEGFQQPPLDELISSSRPIATTTQPAVDSSNTLTHALDPLLAYAREIKQQFEAEVRDYRAMLIKRERINGKLGEESRMELKIRNRRPAENIPLSAYLKFIEPRATRGREVIWVENAHGNRLLSHESGFLNIKRFELEPDGMLAMLGNKYPVTEIGMLRLVEKLIEKGERDKQLGACVVEVIEGQRIGDRECRLFQITHPEPKAGFDFHIAQVFVDTERKIPLRYAAFMWPTENSPPALEEEYTYLDVELNVELTDQDFNPDNPEYNFP